MGGLTVPLPLWQARPALERYQTVNIRKAVITAAAPSQRTLPLQTLVDRDGTQKSALRIILEESLSAGVEEIGIIIHPGDERAYREAIGGINAALHFVEQPEPRGYGHALLCAREFVGGDPFLHLVSDHLYLSGTKGKTSAQQLADIAAAEECAVSAVQATRETMLPYYGAVGGKRLHENNRLYVIDNVLEKPTPTEAEQSLIVPGLRAAHYLCYFGMHVLTPTVMHILADQAAKAHGQIHLSRALAELARRERYLAFEIPGRRHNMGVKFGLLTSQLALGLAGEDREEVLATLVDLLASRGSGE